MAKKVVEIEFRGTEKGFDHALKTTEGFLGRIDQKIRESGKALKTQFNLESLAKGGLIFGAALNAANVASKALGGSIQDAAEAIKSLPLGIGQVARTLEDVLGQWTGITAQIEAANRAVETQNALAAIGVKLAEGRQKAIEASATRTQTIRDKLALVGLEGPDLARTQLQQQFARDQETQQARLQAAIEAVNAASAEKLRTALAGIAIDPAAIEKRARELAPGTGKTYHTAHGMYTIPLDPAAVARAESELRTIQQRQIENLMEAERKRSEEAIRKQFADEDAANAELHKRQMARINQEAAARRWAGLKDAAGSIFIGLKDILRASAPRAIAAPAGPIPSVAAEQIRAFTGERGTITENREPLAIQKRIEASNKRQEAILERVRDVLSKILERLEPAEI